MIKNIDHFAEDEDKTLAPYAVHFKDYPDRLNNSQTEDQTRHPYKRDTDKIVGDPALARLIGKTQVIEYTQRDDHDTTRMIHELKVASIARNIAKRLGLNEYLCEAIALGHDLGHTPFGHAGEHTLNEILVEKGHKEGFEHNRHSIYIIDILAALNFTNAVREGMMKHKSVFDQFNVDFKTQPHLEGQVVNRADEIAYTAHDLEDALSKGVISIEDARKTRLWEIAEQAINEKHPEVSNENPEYISYTVHEMIGFMVDDIVLTTDKMIAKDNIQSVEDVRKSKHELVAFSCETDEMLQEVGELLWNNYYKSKFVQEANERGQKIIRDLFELYYNDTKLLCEDYHKASKNFEEGGDKAIIVRNFIAGMTDRYAISLWEKHQSKIKPIIDEMSKVQGEDN